jgi:MORN repeat variant
MIIGLFGFRTSLRGRNILQPLTIHLFLVILFVYGCKNNKTYKADFFPETKKIKSEGYYINGKPVDTFKTYFENGKIDFSEVYNEKGLLHGEARFYYSNGTVDQVFNYAEGKREGAFTSYWPNGGVKIKGFFFNDKPTGDATYFDKFGRLKQYNFSDFSNNGFMVCQYDSSGKVSGNDDHDFYFLDSIYTVKGENLDTVKTLILISHQPKTFLQLKIDNIGRSGQIVKTQNVETKEQLVYFNNLVTKDVDTIKLTGIRYDSAADKKRTFIIVRNDFREGPK